jgi:hypothetical protein
MKIAIAAEAFGFGPASKAVAISLRLRRLGHQVLPFVDSVAGEYFTANGFAPVSHKLDAVAIGRFAPDAAVVCLDRPTAERCCRLLPTYFVDSLAYMWEESFYADHEFFRRLQRYVVQSTFDSDSRAMSLLPPDLVTPVGAIVDLEAEQSRSAFPSDAMDSLVLLGGLHVGNFAFDASDYWQLVKQVIAPVEQWDVLTSTFARAIMHTGRRLNHRELQARILRARRLVVAPGLTTLLESAGHGLRITPLPPQNYSQIHTVHRVAAAGGGMAWERLANYYKIEEHLPEFDGVRLVADRTRELASDRAAVADMRSMVSDPSLSMALPSDIVRDYDGANEVARLVDSDGIEGFS